MISTRKLGGGVNGSIFHNWESLVEGPPPPATPSIPPHHPSYHHRRLLILQQASSRATGSPNTTLFIKTQLAALKFSPLAFDLHHIHQHASTIILVHHQPHQHPSSTHNVRLHQKVHHPSHPSNSPLLPSLPPIQKIRHSQTPPPLRPPRRGLQLLPRRGPLTRRCRHCPLRDRPRRHFHRSQQRHRTRSR